MYRLLFRESVSAKEVMRMRGKWLVPLAVLCLPLLVNGEEPFTRNQEEAVSVAVRYYAPKLKFESRGFHSAVRPMLGIAGNTFSFRDILGIRNSHAPEYLISWKNWSLDYIRIHENGSNGKRLIGHADLDLDYVALNYKKKFHQSPRNEGYLVGGVRYYQFDFGISLPFPLEKYSFRKKQRQWLPAVGIGGRWYLDAGKKWDLHSELSGGTLGKLGHFYDWDVGLRYRSSPHLGWNVGYRVLDLKIRDDAHPDFSEHGHISSVYKLSGWYGGLEYRF